MLLSTRTYTCVRAISRPLYTRIRQYRTKMSDSMQVDSERCYGTAKNGAKMRVLLSGRESQICDLLRSVSDFLVNERPDLPRIEPRIAGGWVRDKLLGKKCNDLDVAINDMMGYEFAQYINKYLERSGQATKSISKIESNPAKSKHLETATTRLFGLEIDFANLRTEEYSEDSRIPSKITFGSPLQDAYRRDITINSLFYNVITRTVEDFTEKGLRDLQDGLIRTPLKPFETFKDDPLRVLRCVRFASRFGFELVPELVEAAKNQVIREALQSKISRERVGTELSKMLTGPSPLMAVQLLHRLGLYDVVFIRPDNASGTVQDSLVAVKAVGAVRWLSLNVPSLKLSSPEESRIVHLSACLIPFLDVTCDIKNRPAPAVQLVIRDSIKGTNADSNTVSTLFSAIKRYQEAVAKNAESSISRSDLGMLIKDLGSLWTTGLKVSLVQELVTKYRELPWDEPDVLPEGVASDVCAKYVALADKATEYDITDCYKWKPLIDGKRLADMLGIKPGPAIRQLLTEQLRWRLENPEGTVADCEEVMKKYWQSQSAAE